MKNTNLSFGSRSHSDCRKKVNVLYRMGLDNSEISYLIHLQHKRENGSRWHN